MGPLGEFVDEEIDCSESPFDARNYIGTFGHIWPNGVFIINAGGLYLLLCTFPYRVKGHLHDYMRSHSGT